MDAVLEQLEARLHERFQDEASGHDLHHLKRVLNVALRLQAAEGGDRTVIAVAALVHDVHRLVQYETGTFCSPAASLPTVRALLDGTDLTDDQKTRVLHCVRYHEEYAFSEGGHTVDDLETLILQDADNLDALGAVGIARTFAFGGVYRVPMWRPELPFERMHYDESAQDPSVIHHFYSKLLRLSEHLHTPTARRIAAERHRFMETFLDQFFAEWRGER